MPNQIEMTNFRHIWSVVSNGKAEYVGATVDYKRRNGEHQSEGLLTNNKMLVTETGNMHYAKKILLGLRKTRWNIHQRSNVPPNPGYVYAYVSPSSGSGSTLLDRSEEMNRQMAYSKLAGGKTGSPPHGADEVLGRETSSARKRSKNKVNTDASRRNIDSELVKEASGKSKTEDGSHMKSPDTLNTTAPEGSMMSDGRNINKEYSGQKMPDHETEGSSKQHEGTSGVWLILLSLAIIAHIAAIIVYVYIM